MLFARSVRENIMYGCENATDAEMHKAAKQASAHEFIMELSKGYDTGSLQTPQLAVGPPNYIFHKDLLSECLQHF